MLLWWTIYVETGRKRKLGTSVESGKLFIAGGFQEETKSVLLSGHSVTLTVPEHDWTQEEADTKIILHSVYSAKILHVSCAIIHAHDTDDNILDNLDELWVWTDHGAYLPIHEIFNVWDRAPCKALQFLHSFSGKDTTSHPYFTGKQSRLLVGNRNPAMLSGMTLCLWR